MCNDWRPVTYHTVNGVVEPDDSIPNKRRPLLLFGANLIDDDFNPEGVVEGFWQDDYGWIIAGWNPIHDFYTTEVYTPEDGVITHWQNKPQPPREAIEESAEQ